MLCLRILMNLDAGWRLLRLKSALVFGLPAAIAVTTDLNWRDFEHDVAPHLNLILTPRMFGSNLGLDLMR